MNKKIIFGIIVCFVFLLNVEYVFGCSCGRGSLDTYFGESDFVFLGTVEKIELNNPPFNEVSIKTDRFWKGIENDNVVVQTHMHGATCGFSFVQNQTYLIFADQKENGILSTALCSGNRSIENLAPGWLFLLDTNLLFLGNVWMEFLVLRFWYLWITIIFGGVAIFFFLRKRRSYKPNRNFKSEGELS